MMIIPIEVTLAGIVTDVKPVQSLKATLPKWYGYDNDDDNYDYDNDDEDDDTDRVDTSRNINRR